MVGAYREVMRGRTTVLITHRKEVLRGVDRVVEVGGVGRRAWTSGGGGAGLRRCSDAWAEIAITRFAGASCLLGIERAGDRPRFTNHSPMGRLGT